MDFWDLEVVPNDKKSSKLSHYETSERTAMFERGYFQLIRTGIRNCIVERYYIFTSDKVQSVQSV